MIHSLKDRSHVQSFSSDNLGRCGTHPLRGSGGPSASAYTFPATSYCGGYGGPAEQFLIGLRGKQDLVFGDASKGIRVRDPRGEFLEGVVDDRGALKYRSVVAGDHLIQTKGEGLTFFKVCAIDSPDKPFYPAKVVMS